MAESTPLPARLTGGNFLLADTDPNLVFTPESLSPEDRQMADTAGKFMDKEVFPRLEALEHQEAGLARKLFNKAGELGLLCIETPEEYDGLGLGKTTAIGVSQQLSRLPGFGITCGAHTGIGMQPLSYFGTKAQKKKYLSRLATGQWMGAYCLSETASGSDALAMKTKAVRAPDGSHYVLNGVKMWITNAGWADLFTVFAKVDGQHVTAFLVESTFPGVSTGKEEHKLGIKSSSTRRVILEDVKVPVENVLGEVGKGAYIAFNILNFGRFSLGAGIIGAAKDQIRIATRYALERQQFGKPIASFGLIQQKLAGMAVKTFAAESAVYRTAGLIDELFATSEILDSMTPPFPRALDEFALECSLIKVRCSEIQFEVADESIQVHGGYGYTEEFPAARALRDSRINRIFEGTNEINRLFIPDLLQKRAQRGRFPLAHMIGSVVKELSASAPPVDSGDDLENARRLLAGAKKLVFFLSGLAFKTKAGDEQEVRAALSDIIIEIYFGESAVLRALKTQARGGQSSVQNDLALLFINESVVRMESAARLVMEVCLERKDFAAHLVTVRRLLSWLPFNSVARRQKVARQVCDCAGYPA
jgi:alkylation response protein AidB-like acyl-CoA dehydrogenase